ncbi:phage tail tape measure protein [Nocardiopsis sp. CT-R113]|uniref:Phage tail tape measure protein n=1 Tax=Nocardiopsis codii TaxID=3065942 RepID=A0ABU7KD63_9ACTN|nr:phage tail tape measure protein [Nocardiopsis sp. CT-R113]MEE2040174.1 phage tail tape measure protein [Nocardiopsis sp. CT-R113]
MATTVGAVWLNVLPSMRDFTKRLTGEATSAASRAAKVGGAKLGADMVDEASKEVRKTSAKAAREAGEKIADEATNAATKKLPREMGKVGEAAGRALSESASKAAASSLPAAMTAASTKAAQDAVAAVAKTTERTLPAALSAQAGRAGEQAGAAMSRAMAQSYQPPTGGFSGWVSSATTAAREAGSAAMSSLGGVMSAAGPAITSTLSGVVGGAIVAASRDGVARAGEAWSSAGAAMASAGQETTTALSLPMAAFGALTLKTAGDFEQQMNRVRAVTGATGGEFDSLTALAQELGATTQYSASEAADAMGFLAMAGFDTDQIMSALPDTLNLAAAGAIDLGEAADIASNILTGYGFQAEELGRVNDILTETFTSSNVNMQMLGYSFKYIAPVANSAGLQFEEVAAAVGMLGNAGIQGEQAGTSLRGAISRLLKPTGAVADTLDDLGVSVSDSSGQMLGLADIFEQLETAGATTSDMITIFGLEAGPGMMALLDQGSGAMRDFTAELENSGGAAETIADIQMEGLNGAIREMKSAFEGLLLAVADSGLLDAVTARVESLALVIQDLSETNPELLNTAASVGMFLAALGPIIWIGGRVVGTIGAITTAVGGTGKFLAEMTTGWKGAGTVWAAGTPLVTRLTAAIRTQYLAMKLVWITTGRATAAMILHNTWAKIVRVATLAWQGAQWLLNAALNANPIGLVVIAIAALVGGLLLAYRNVDVFRVFVDDLWVSAKALFAQLEPLVPVFLQIAKVTIGIAFAPLIAAFLLLRTVGRAAWSWLQPAFEWLSDFWTTDLQPKVQAIGDTFTAAWSKVQTAWRLLTGLLSGDVSLDEIGAAFRRAGTDIANWLRARGEDIADWVKELPSRLAAGASDLADTIRDWFAPLPGVLAGVGRDVVDWVKDLPRLIWEGGTGLGESFLGLLRNLSDPATLTQIGQDIAGQITGGLDWLLDQAALLPSKLAPKLDAVVSAVVAWAQELPDRIEAKVSDLADRVTDWASEVGPAAVDKLQSTGEDIAAWFRGLPARVRDWVDIDAFVEWAREIPGRIRDMVDIDAAVAWVLDMKDRAIVRLGEVADSVMEWARGLPDKIRGWIDNAAQIQAWFVEWGPKIVAGLGIAFLVVALAIPALLATVAASILFVLGVIVMELGVWIWERFTGLMETAAAALQSKVNAVGAKFRQIRDQAVAAILNLRDRVLAYFTNLRDQAAVRVQALRDRVVGALINARDRAVAAVLSLRDRAVGYLTTLRDWGASRASALRDRIVTPLQTMRDRAIEAFRAAKDGIQAAWRQVESITKKPVSFIVNRVYNDGIRATWNKVAGLVGMNELGRINGFKTGGIMPGYTPGRDPHKFFSPTGGRLELSGGEAIMRPEFTRAVGPGWVNTINAAARSGGIGGVQSVLGFANGGVYGGVQSFSEGGILGRLATFGSNLGSIFDGDGLAGAASQVLDPLIETMRGRFTEGRWAQAMVSVPSAMIDKLLDWLKNTVGEKLGGNGKAVADAARGHLGISGNPNQFTRAFGMNGLAWCAMFVSEVIKQVKAQDAYSNIRSAAVASFANSSMDSVRGVGNTRPGDLAVYQGSGPGGWQHINVIVDEHGGTVGGNESNAVRFSSGYSSRAAKFMRPRAFADGGLWWQDTDFNTQATTPPLTRLLQGLDTVPTLYDTGGWLMPGLQLVANQTGRPEPVLTDRQWADLRAAREGVRGRERPNQTFHITETGDPRITARKVMTAQSDWDALHPA